MTIYERMKVSSAVGVVLLTAIGITSAFFDVSAVFDLVLTSTLFTLTFIAVTMLGAPLIVKIVPLKNEQGREWGPIGIILAFVALVGMGFALLIHAVTF